jgi:hypothetical protein
MLMSLYKCSLKGQAERRYPAKMYASRKATYINIFRGWACSFGFLLMMRNIVVKHMNEIKHSTPSSICRPREVENNP